jgi:hypothetical protein
VFAVNWGDSKAKYCVELSSLGKDFIQIHSVATRINLQDFDFINRLRGLDYSEMVGHIIISGHSIDIDINCSYSRFPSS